jgi:ADP-ribose pyrophosphatase YjhB (NUDIX family)
MNKRCDLNYCSSCGAELESRVPPGDTEQRAWCARCEIAHYKNPTILVAAFLHCGNKLFWTQRGIAPFKGLWAFPAGFMECGESIQQAAARELFEETRLRIDPARLIPMSISSVLPIDQVYMVFRCACDTELVAETTEESLDWGWFQRSEAPWDKMAHPGSTALVEQVYEAIESGQFFMRVGQMAEDGNRHQSYLLRD